MTMFLFLQTPLPCIRECRRLLENAVGWALAHLLKILHRWAKAHPAKYVTGGLKPTLPYFNAWSSLLEIEIHSVNQCIGLRAHLGAKDRFLVVLRGDFFAVLGDLDAIE